MIDLTKKYTTRLGLEVVLFSIYDDEVFGAYIEAGKNIPAKWNLSGRANSVLTSDIDLIEVPLFCGSGFEQGQIVRFVDVYGEHLLVPVWAKYIFVTAGGSVYVSRIKPKFNCDTCCWNFFNLEMYQRVGDFSKLKGNIKDSLEEI